MSFRGLVRGAVGAIALLTLVSSCSSEETQGIRVPLSGSNDTGTIYVLEDARFRVAGPTTITLAGNDTNGNVVSAGLPVGDYTVTLLTGWTLVRLPEGTPMIATLASPNPQSVTIMDGARVQVTFVFEVMGELVSMTGDGDLDIGFFVSEDASPGVVDGGVTCLDGEMRVCGPPQCNGAEACMAGTWTPCVCSDQDADGFVFPEDCDDASPMISPAAPEQCGNTRDDDCDGTIDEDCSGCVPAPEQCNASDDDCDGFVDEDFMCQLGMISSCVSSCGTVGTRACGPSCTFGACMPPAETCNTIDDDCDGTIDEGCSGCMPMSETCNGLDDDCDFVVDEGVGGGACGFDQGQCSPGMLVCVGGALSCQGGVGPSAEVCNGVDDDCDANVDEGNPGGGMSCGSSGGECEPGTLVCVAGAMTCQGAVGPTPEVCNGLDDDCDGMVDDGC